MKLFNTDKEFYLPKEYIGEKLKKSGYTKTAPRIWTKEEILWAKMLKSKGFKNKDIAKFLYRNITSVSIKMKRLSKSNGKTYNKNHREDKYYYNTLFLDIIKPKSVLDLYAGEVSFYKGKVSNLVTNDSNKSFNSDYREKAEKLIAKLYYENQKFDIIDLDPFGSAFDCFDLAIKQATKGLIITLGELGHKRFKRLDFVKRYYNINSIEEFTPDNLIKVILNIGLRNKKNLIPIYTRNYKNISRVYFKLEPVKIIEKRF